MQNSNPPSPALREILHLIAQGNLSVDEAFERLANDQMVAIDGATIDLGRAKRCRFGEVIYGEGKSAALITNIAREQLAYGQPVLITRLAEAVALEVASAFPHVRHHPIARTLRISNQPITNPTNDETPEIKPFRPHVAVVSAGSTDGPVAAEAVETLGWMNVMTEQYCDIGVAGPQRLLAVVPKLRRACAIVAVAGMEAALSSVVGGHVACPIIAVPTSVGYGTNFGGVTALLGMLTSCTSNVTVVGIDAGFKGGYVAGLIATQLEDHIIKSRC